MRVVVHQASGWYTGPNALEEELPSGMAIHPGGNSFDFNSLVGLVGRTGLWDWLAGLAGRTGW